jgi:hypothetical protein
MPSSPFFYFSCSLSSLRFSTHPFTCLVRFLCFIL